ncbi:TAT-variant-translocated molybdopterin oxidoreductase [Planctomycetota bacterium]|nr:TAT-variant-translocated molybdopterin oxidoreductase [Planctomycetota bacterium]
MGTTYWRSLEHLADTPEFRERMRDEFPSHKDALLDPVTRRGFLKVMGASMALAGLTGCDLIRWPQEQILPFARRPTGRHPGTPEYFATAIEIGGVATGLLAKSYDGRPIKVEGNPDHPGSLGATDSFAQASVLQLYDPDRSPGVAKSEGDGGLQPSTWADFEAWSAERLSTLEGQDGVVAVICEATSSPTVAALRARLQAQHNGLKWVEWEPLGRDNTLAGSKLALGGEYRAHLDLERADIVVCLDADPLFSDPDALRMAREFAKGRKATDGVMNRLYCVESTQSLTSGMADHRLALPASQIQGFALALAAAVVSSNSVAAQQSLKDALAPHAAPDESLLKAHVDMVAADLLGNRGRSVVAVGERQPAAVHALGHLINSLLGNANVTVRYTREPAMEQRGNAALASLADDMNNGRVDTVLVVGSNPVAYAPANLGFAAAFKKVPHRIHLGMYRDETAAASTWHLPQGHYLESWGDAASWDGTQSVVQPLIAPLLNGRSTIEVLAHLTKDNASNGYDLVRRTLKGTKSDEVFEGEWRRALHDGVVAASAATQATPQVLVAAVQEAVAGATAADAPTASKLELIFTRDNSVYDGRFSNVSWLQELPDPLTKLTWDNALLVNPHTADELDLKGDDLVTLTAGGKTLDVAVYVLPGLPDFTVSLSLGYGRSAAGMVGNGCGFDSYVLRADGANVVTGVTLSKTGKTYQLATTQDHHTVDSQIGQAEIQRRLGHDAAEEKTPHNAMLVREATLAELQEDPDTVRKSIQAIIGPDPYATKLWEEPIDFKESRHRWGMTIDLSACTGCGSCITACQAENNIPVVGKTEVIRGREMHWLRIDRYFSGDPRAPWGNDPGLLIGGLSEKPPLRVIHQPIPCMQCENAPCESVCPVAATSHSEDGLNDMVYNRCIGTRYCANNCPFKVRRFNYFWNHHGPAHPRSEPFDNPELPKPPEVTKQLTKLEQMVFNPEVSVRSRGVMEKCTYCVHRIRDVSIQARNERRPVRDGEVRTACQQVCPSEAIEFGDLQDTNSRVAKAQEDPRCYGMLEEINTRPRTKFLAKLRNPRVAE